MDKCKVPVCFIMLTLDQMMHQLHALFEIIIYNNVIILLNALRLLRGQVVLSAVQPDTIARRFATRQLSEQEGKGEEHE